MAYGNWGAFVYRNGERMREWEDQTPYQEQRLVPGYHQAFGLLPDAQTGEVAKRTESDLRTHHAVLGQQRVRLCGYKCYAVLFIDGKRVEDLTPYELPGDPDAYSKDINGEFEGYEFRAEHEANFVALYLREPDGTVWTSRCGYEYGSGHMD